MKVLRKRNIEINLQNTHQDMGILLEIWKCKQKKNGSAHLPQFPDVGHPLQRVTTQHHWTKIIYKNDHFYHHLFHHHHQTKVIVMSKMITITLPWSQWSSLHCHDHNHHPPTEGKKKADLCKFHLKRVKVYNSKSKNLQLFIPRIMAFPSLHTTDGK